VLPVLQKRELGILGIKSLGGHPAKILRSGKYTAKDLLRFSMSQPITTQIVGMKSLENLHDNLALVRNFTPMKPAEMEKLVAQLSTDNAAQAYAQYHLPGYRDGHGLVA
jgi:hypothetical protein